MVVLDLAACVLHNFLRTWDMNYSQHSYYSDTQVDSEDTGAHRLVPGSWRKRLCGALGKHKHVGSNNYPVRAGLLRDGIADYFVTKFAVPWQNNYVRFATFNPVNDAENDMQ